MVSRDRRYLMRWMVGLFSLTLLYGCGLAAQPLELPILQFNQNRFYFGVGTEQLVFEHAPFKIINQSDTLYGGTIEYSGLGVCYSRPIDDWSDTTSIHSMHALIEPAEIELPCEISLYYDVTPAARLNRSGIVSYGVEPYCTEFLPPDTGKRLCMSYEWRGGVSYFDTNGIDCDGLFHWKPLRKNRSDLLSIQFEAPYMAVLIPNPALAANDNGLLTTSLYYRFNDRLLDQIFDKGEAEPINRLYWTSEQIERRFPYDIHQGQALLNRIANKLDTMAIAAGWPEGNSVADYFADILSHDRIRTYAVSEYDSYPPAIMIQFFPYHKSESLAGIEKIYQALDRQNKTRYFRETLARAKDKIDQYKKTDDEEIKTRLLQQIDAIFQKDLGVFPLFRPKLYFTAAKHLQRVEFDADDYPIYEKMIKVKLPQPPDGEKR